MFLCLSSNRSLCVSSNRFMSPVTDLYVSPVTGLRFLLVFSNMSLCLFSNRSLCVSINMSRRSLLACEVMIYLAASSLCAENLSCQRRFSRTVLHAVRCDQATKSPSKQFPVFFSSKINFNCFCPSYLLSLCDSA